MKDGLVLAFDFGLKHIGVACAQTITGQASGVSTLKAHAGKPNWREIDALVDQYQPVQMVVGLPLNMDGTESTMSNRARRFADQLTTKTGRPTALQDERLTSRVARDHLQAAQACGQASSDHELAACFIVEDWLRNS